MRRKIEMILMMMNAHKDLVELKLNYKKNVVLGNRDGSETFSPYCQGRRLDCYVEHLSLTPTSRPAVMQHAIDELKKLVIKKSCTLKSYLSIIYFKKLNK